MLSDIQSFALMLPHSNAGEPTRETGNIAAHSLNLSRSVPFSMRIPRRRCEFRSSAVSGHGVGCMHGVYLSLLARIQRLIESLADEVDEPRPLGGVSGLSCSASRTSRSRAPQVALMDRAESRTLPMPGRAELTAARAIAHPSPASRATIRQRKCVCAAFWPHNPWYPQVCR